MMKGIWNDQKIFAYRVIPFRLTKRRYVSMYVYDCICGKLFHYCKLNALSIASVLIVLYTDCSYTIDRCISCEETAMFELRYINDVDVLLPILMFACDLENTIFISDYYYCDFKLVLVVLMVVMIDATKYCLTDSMIPLILLLLQIWFCVTATALCDASMHNSHWPWVWAMSITHA